METKYVKDEVAREYLKIDKKLKVKDKKGKEFYVEFTTEYYKGIKDSSFIEVFDINGNKKGTYIKSYLIEIGEEEVTIW